MYPASLHYAIAVENERRFARFEERESRQGQVLREIGLTEAELQIYQDRVSGIGNRLWDLLDRKPRLSRRRLLR